MVRMASRGDTPHGGSYVCNASKTTHQRSLTEIVRRGPRTEEPEPAKVEGTTGRAGRALCRLSSVGADWVQ